MRLALLVAFLSSFFQFLAYPTPARAAECQFVLGFKTLHDIMPTIVGDCLENEHHNPTNGDGLQRTTGGLLVWRKADNNTAFTDGSRTWVLGPFGLQSRPNTQRFDWEFQCIDVGAATCLRVEPALADAVAVLRRLDDGPALLQAAATLGVRVLSVPTPRTVRGIYSAFTNTLFIDSRLEASTAEARAAVLAHELQHAADDAAGRLALSGPACFEAEARAFGRQAQIWQQLWPAGLPADLDVFYRELNDITRTVTRDPAGFARSLIRTYRTECTA